MVILRATRQLAAAAVGDALRRAERIQQAPAFEAELRLQAIGRRVQAGVNDLAVARTGDAADRGLGFDDHHLAAGRRQGAGDGQADDAGADDEGVYVLIHPTHRG